MIFQEAVGIMPKSHWNNFPMVVLLKIFIIWSATFKFDIFQQKIYIIKLESWNLNNTIIMVKITPKTKGETKQLSVMAGDW